MKSLLLVTSLLVAAMFIGSAAAGGINGSQGTSINEQQSFWENSKTIKSVPLPPGTPTQSTHPSTPKRTTILSEGFEGAFPPTDWTQIITNTGYTWKSETYNPHSGSYYTNCEYDPALDPQDEWLITPVLDFTGYGSISLSFWWYMSYYWGVDPYDNYDINVLISTDGGSTWTLLWNEDNIGVFTNWVWYDATFGTHIDLSSYIGQTNVKLGFQYIGTDGAEAALDDILVDGLIAGEHNLGILSIDTPESGNAGVITPTVTIINRGENDETNVPLQLTIGTRQVTSSLEDFESTDGGYTATGSPSALWEWGTPTQSTGPSSAHSGTNVWGTDLDANYPSSTNNKLTSPSFVVPENGELTFWHWYDTEAYYDGGNVKISTDGGTTWTILYPVGGYPEDAAYSGNAGIPGEPCFSGHIQKYWEEEAIDLSAYSGQTVQIRFHFGSDSSVNYPGWFIDDVSINAIEWVSEYDETQTFDITSGSTVQISLPPWTPAALNTQEDITIDYNAEATVTLDGDVDPTDNYLAKPFSLYYGYFHDVAVTQIVSPVSGLAQPQTPEVLLANNGQNSETVNVSITILKAAYTLYLEEYFEGDFPPAGWTNQIIQNHGWLRNDQTIDQRPNYAGGEGYCADADADDVGSGGPWPMECALISPSMDLSTVTGAVLTCTEAFNSLGGDYADVDISVDGGATWTNLQHWTVDHSPSGPGENVQFDLSDYCGNVDVKVRFLYYADGWDWYYEVDNVKVFTIEYSSEYAAYQSVDIDAGATMNVVFPETWTPSDMTFGFDLDYKVTATATLSGFITIGTEGFEDYTAGHYDFPAGWTVTPTNPASTWFVYGTGTTHTPKCQETNSLGIAQNELLTSPSSNFVGMNTIRLKYTAYFYRSSTVGDSYVEVLGSLDGGVTWPTLITTYMATGGVSYTEDFDISAWAANMPSVTIGYRFVSDADVDLTDYFYFDGFWVGNVISLMNQESFESYTPGHYVYPAGWTVQQMNPTSTWYVFGSGTTSTSRCEELGSQDLAQNELLISPSINCMGLATIKLQYSAYFYRSATNGDSYVEVIGSLDGGITWPTLITTYMATGGVSYTEDFDISAWAANMPSVTIGYRFVSDADVNLTDYFYFDNFWVGNAFPIVTEGFNSYTAGYYGIPAGWTVLPTNPTSTWFVYGTGTTHQMKCQEAGKQNLAQNELLTSPVFNLGGMTVVKLQYSAYFYRSSTNGDSYVEVLGSIDGGVTWPTLIKTYNAVGGVSYSEDIDISSWAANQPTVVIGYRFVSPADANLTDYFYFDGFWIGNEQPVVTEYFNNYVAGYYAMPTGWTIQVTNPTGKWWMYQSGTTIYPKVNESGSNQQAQDEWLISKVINCTAFTNVSLQYYRYFYKSSTGGDSSGQVRGSIDDGVTWPYYIANYTATSSGSEAKYITSWAAGQANVKIAFRFQSTADSALNDYFYVDDFFVGVLWGPNGNNPPTGWTILNYGSQSPQVWDNNDWHRYSTSSYPAQGQFARVYYSPVENSNEWLISPSINCSGLSSVTLEFWHYFNWYSTISRGWVNGSLDGGATWPYSIAAFTTADDGPAVKTYDISAWAAGQYNVMIAFQYKDNNGMYWYVDDFKIKSDTTTLYVQNFEGVGYGENFASNYIPAQWGPLGWYITPTGDTHWSVTSTSYAGGASPEARFYWSPSVTADISLCSGSIDTSAYTTMTLSFKHYVDWSTSTFTLRVDTSTDGTTWGTVWSIAPTGDIPASTVAIPLNSTHGIGSSTFRMRFTFSGYTYNINYWYIDNVKLGTMVTVYTTTFNENWIPPSWGPLGWQVSPPGDTHWSQSATNYAGGTSPELKFSYSPSQTGNFSFYSGPIDTSAYTTLTLSFNHYVNHYATPYTLKAETSADGTTWVTVWSISPTGDVPATTVIVPLTGTEGIGSSMFQMRFTFSGYTFNIDYWYIDDVKLGTVVTLYATSFDENWLPPSWGPGGFTDVIMQGTHGWLRNDLYSRPNYAGGSGFCADADADKVGSGGPWPMEAALLTPVVDLSGVSSATLSYIAAYNALSGDYADVDVTVDGGTTWTNILHWTVDHSAYGPGEAVQLDLSSFCGNANVQVRFLYYADSWDYYFEVDDIAIGTVSTVYNTTFDENWIPTSWGLTGWAQVVVSGTDPDNEWDVVAGGSYPVALPHGGSYMAQYDSFNISSGNSCRLYLINPLNFQSIGSPAIQATMWMYHDPGYSSSDDRIEVQISLDGTIWTTVSSFSRYAAVAHWEQHTVDLSAYVNEPAVYLGFLGVSEYGNSMYMDDLSLQYFGEYMDENPSDNELVKWITLTYEHDVGVTAITEPTGPGGVWPPGTYHVAGVVENFGVTFPESNIPVEAIITHVDNSTVIYDEIVTVPGPLAPGGTAAVTFPDFTLENLTAWEGKYKVEIMTTLAGDDHPENDKQSMTFTMAITDVIAPITTHSFAGTIGENDWYVSNIVITLTAVDPAPPIKSGPKPPSGVNHTYYKLHAADNWTEYTTPVIVNTDGTFELFYYSIDKAGNAEAQKGPFAFKLDKTVPTITLTVMPLNLFKTKWLLNATVDDVTSGVALVEFYIDDQLVANVTAPGPYIYNYKGNGLIAQAIVYDMAGNSAMSAQVQEYIPNVNSQPVSTPNVQQNQLLQQQ